MGEKQKPRGVTLRWELWGAGDRFVVMGKSVIGFAWLCCCDTQEVKRNKIIAKEKESCDRDLCSSNL